MVQPSLTLLAQGGNASAIAHLMNYTLKSKGISSRAALRAGCLYVRLDGPQVPDEELLSAFVHLSVLKLAIQSIETLVIYGFKEGASQPAWTQKIYLAKQRPTFAGLQLLNGSSSILPPKVAPVTKSKQRLKFPVIVQNKRPKTRRIVQIINRQTLLKQFFTSALVALVGIVVTGGLIIWLDSVDKKATHWQRSSVEWKRWG